MKKCKINILDEVNCKLEGLDISDTRLCVNALKFKLPYAYHMPSVKLGKWDGTVSFYSVGGGTQINLLNKILPLLEDRGYDFDINDMRTPNNIELKAIDKDIFGDFNWPSTHSTKPNQPIELREDQVATVNLFVENLQGIQIIPTGGGKTITTAAMSKVVEPFGRSIIIVPSKQLVKQTYEDYKLVGLDAGMYFGDHKDWNKQHTICTWQSLEVLLKNTKAGTADNGTINDFIEGVVCVIVDEAHQAKADVLKKLLSGLFRNVPIRWGLTGTIPKDEIAWMGILGCIGEVIRQIQISEFQDSGILSKCEIDVIQTQHLKKFSSFQDEYTYLVTDPDRLKWMSELMSVISDSGNTLILVKRIETGKMLEQGIPGSVFVSGGTKVADRETEYKEIATVDNKVVIATYGIAAVGINIPRIFNLVLIEPGKSFVQTIQSIGRGLRRAQDKDFVKIYDICAGTKYSKKHLTERKKFYNECQYPFKIFKTDI